MWQCHMNSGRIFTEMKRVIRVDENCLDFGVMNITKVAKSFSAMIGPEGYLCRNKFFFFLSLQQISDSSKSFVERLVNFKNICVVRLKLYGLHSCTPTRQNSKRNLMHY